MFTAFLFLFFVQNEIVFVVMKQCLILEFYLIFHKVELSSPFYKMPYLRPQQQMAEWRYIFDLSLEATKGQKGLDKHDSHFLDQSTGNSE